LVFGTRYVGGGNPVYSAFYQNSDGSLRLVDAKIGSISLNVVIYDVFGRLNYAGLINYALNIYLDSKTILHNKIAKRWAGFVYGSIQRANEEKEVPQYFKKEGITLEKYRSVRAMSTILSHIQLGDIVIDSSCSPPLK
jgi:hypothetical protein